MPDQWEVRLQCPEDKHEVILALLSESAPTASWSDEGELKVYFDSFQSLEKIEALCGPHISGIEIEMVKPLNWNKKWESEFQAVEIENFCRIRADFHAPKEEEFEHEITINPKMSFGTGHHETTSMMIMGMQKMDFENKEVLDFGTGTGVLGILASKMGAHAIWANDIDDYSIENTLENMDVNGIRNMEVKQGPLEVLDHRKYDVILANINRQVLLDTATPLKEILKDGGKLLISGILKQDLQRINKTYASIGFKELNVTQKGDWIAVLYE